ncbi:zinc finger protein 816-like [Anopheles maculipalpis]|uniref:zinc finger protein 816-like n=1 Tax=Anopheles maculipalpis TaxID=1496333 RepID=UPI002159742B|nr:zinc finger protein 816-like [Anopheles maculipalpis]
MDICRLCLCEDKLSLVNAADIIDSSLTIETIEQFTGIRINVAGTYPSAICLNCKGTLHKSVGFRHFCLSNDVRFKKLLRSKIQSTVESANETEPNILVGAGENNKDETIEQLQKEIKTEQKEMSTSEPSTDNDSESQCKPKTKAKRKMLKRKQQLCVLCGKTVNYLARHMNSHTKNNIYSCPHCSMQLTDSSNLKRHIEAVHLKKAIVFCEICNKGFTHKNSLECHMRSQHGTGNTYDCKLCDKTYKHPGGYRHHMAQVHTYASEKRFPCSICSKRFDDRLALKRHGRVHSSDRPYACGVCPKQFKSSYAKITHEITHTGAVFPCTVCEKKYRYKSLLSQHMRKDHPVETD